MTNWLLQQKYVLEQAGLDQDETVRDMLRVAAYSDDAEVCQIIREALEYEVCDALIESDPFAPHPSPETLQVPGIFVGTHHATGSRFYWGYDEQRDGIMILGAPQGGKTNLALWLIELLVLDKEGPPTCVWCYCLRFDYVGLSKVLPRTRAIKMSTGKWNVLKPPSGVPPETWFSAFAGKIADNLQLQTAGRQFLSRHIMELYTSEFKKANRWPAVKDLIIYFEQLSTESRDEQGYKARVLEKLRAFEAPLRCLLDCEEGYNFEKLLDEGWNLIFVMADLDKNICDLLTTVTMDYAYYYRMFNDEKPRTRLFLILDEQRHLIRERKWE